MTFPAFIDATAVDTMSSCEQKYVYSILQELRPRGNSIHLHAGGAFSRGLEILRHEFYDNHKSLEESLFLGQAAMLLAWGDKGPVMNTPGEPAKNLQNMLGALEFYVQTWNPATDHLQPAILNGKAAVEFSFSIPLPECFNPDTGEPMLYAGRFDMLGLYNGVLFVNDEKTSSSLGASWMKQWDMRGQFAGYCWAARQYGFPVAGAIVRGVSILKRDYGSAEALVYWDDWKVDQWLAATQAKFARAVELYKGRPPIRSYGEACNAYSGCPFQILCNSHDPAHWLGDFTKRDWNPLTRMSEPVYG